MLRNSLAFPNCFNKVLQVPKNIQLYNILFPLKTFLEQSIKFNLIRKMNLITFAKQDILLIFGRSYKES